MKGEMEGGREGGRGGLKSKQYSKVCYFDLDIIVVNKFVY